MMKNTAYTSGPWVAEKHPMGHYGIFQKDHPHQVAEVLNRLTPPAMVEANALLIAAAPEMLTALIHMHAAGRHAGVPDTDWHMAMLNRVIVKATGVDSQTCQDVSTAQHETTDESPALRALHKLLQMDLTPEQCHIIAQGIAESQKGN